LLTPLEFELAQKRFETAQDLRPGSKSKKTV
jgi:hypothetical protein